MRFVIKGAPRTAKNHQRIVTNKKTGKPFIISSAPAASWGPQAVNQLVAQKRGMCAIAGPLHVRALIYRDRNTGDLDNYQHAVGDALQKAGVILNDRNIESWDGTRKLIDRANPRVEITIEPMPVE